jgi:hypothetical protein
MTLFIQPLNQNLLWNIINKYPYFQKLPIHLQEPWFKNCIGVLYEKNKYTILTKETLFILNYETLQYMKNQLKEHFEAGSGEQLPDFTIQETKRKERGSHVKFADEFIERQNLYKDMIKTEIPPEPNFKENVEDTAIENMDELLEKHLKERELDLNHRFENETPERVSFEIFKGLIQSKKTNIPNILHIGELIPETDFDLFVFSIKTSMEFCPYCNQKLICLNNEIENHNTTE